MIPLVQTMHGKENNMKEEDLVLKEGEAAGETAGETEEVAVAEVDWNSLPKTDGTRMYMAMTAKYPLLTKEEEFDLAEKAKAGDEEAKERLICSNLRLVINLAKDKMGKGLELDDLIQEGNAGLITAVERFDATKGHRFATYASWWIKEAMSGAIQDCGKTIRLPKHVTDETNFIKKALNELGQALGRDPSDTETYRYLDGKFGKERFRELMEIIRCQGTASLDAFIGDDEKTRLGDTVEGSVKGMKEEIYESDRQRAIDEVLGGLSPMNRRILELRYDLDSLGARTLEETANALKEEGYLKGAKATTGITKERVRQLEKETLECIRQSEEKMRLLRSVI